MSLLQIELFYLTLALLACGIGFAVYAARKRRAALQAILGKRFEDPAFVRVSHGRRALRIALLFSALLLAGFSAARPFWGMEKFDFSGRGRDILAVFDVSRSMLATDVAPSRLAHAKFLLKRLAQTFPADRFGLISFAGNAFLECPFTADKVSFLQYVDDLSPDSIPVGGTNLERALTIAGGAFEGAATPNRAIVLFTDGEELSGSAEATFAAIRKLKIPIYVVGVGDAKIPALIPNGDDGKAFLRDAKGALVRTRLNEALLRKIAEASGGAYYPSSAAVGNFDALSAAIAKLDSAEQENRQGSRPIERFPYFLAAALLLLTGAFLVSERGAGKAAVLILILFLLPGYTYAAPPPLSRLPDAAQTRTTPEAAALPLTETAPRTPQEQYNKALEFQKMQEKQKAAGLYAEALKHAAKEPEVAARALYNLGISGHTDARENLAKAVRETEAQQLDAAEKTAETAEKSALAAQELYRQSLTLPSSLAPELRSGTLQMLLDDLARIKELKRKIEELKKQQQQTREKTQQAKQENERKKQDSQNSGKPNAAPEKQPSDAMQQAQNAAKELQKKAEEMKQEKLAGQAKQVQEDLQKAESEQQKKEFDKASKHLDDALKKLGEADGGKQEPKQGEREQPGKDRQEQPEKQTAPQQPPQAPRNGGGKPEEKASEQMLELLANEEKDLKDEWKKMRKQQHSRENRVEKDW